MKTKFLFSVALILAFILWTVAVSFIDVQPIGPEGSKVGFASLNQAFHGLTGVHFELYRLTDLLSIVPLFLCILFALTGLVQLIKRKSLFKIDGDIIALGIFYLITFGAFVFFEIFIINYRPVIIEGALEASYPSSTTMLCMCTLPTAAMQFSARIKHTVFRNIIIILCILLCAFMVICRLISGVHWLTDIVGGALLSAGLVLLYSSLCDLISTQ